MFISNSSPRLSIASNTSLFPQKQKEKTKASIPQGNPELTNSFLAELCSSNMVHPMWIRLLRELGWNKSLGFASFPSKKLSVIELTPTAGDEPEDFFLLARQVKDAWEGINSEDRKDFELHWDGDKRRRKNLARWELIDVG